MGYDARRNALLYAEDCLRLFCQVKRITELICARKTGGKRFLIVLKLS
jgi:hypothetical protein